MGEGSIPFQGGDSLLRKTDPLDLENPLPFNQKSIDEGKKHFGFYCALCHGSKGDGLGPVGQSFYPLPRNLRSPQVQEKSDGFLFSVISYGQKRMPPLATTVAQRDRWLIVHYLRTLAGNSEEQQ
jgi:mono/diheme cytochrome c family protein